MQKLVHLENKHIIRNDQKCLIAAELGARINAWAKEHCLGVSQTSLFGQPMLGYFCYWFLGMRVNSQSPSNQFVAATLCSITGFELKAIQVDSRWTCGANEKLLCVLDTSSSETAEKYSLHASAYVSSGVAPGVCTDYNTIAQ